MPSLKERLSKLEISWEEVALVIIAGTVGGGMPLIYLLTVGKAPSVRFPWNMLAYPFLGIGAGYLGVYVIAKKGLLSGDCFQTVYNEAFYPPDRKDFIP